MESGDKRRVGLYFSGKPVLIKDLNIALTPPTINDIVMYGEDNFLFNTQLIVSTDEFVEEIKRGNSELEIYSNFQLLMTLVREDNHLRNEVEEFFNFIFPDYKVVFTENSIDFKIILEDEKEKIVGRITPFNYDSLKNIIDILFLSQVGEKEIEYNPINDKAKEIAEKIKAGRKKAQQLNGEKTKDQSMFAQMISSLAVGMQMDVNIFYKYTPFQLYDIYKRFFLKQSYDFYQKVATTPLMDTSKMETPREWTDFIY